MDWEKLNVHLENLVPGLATLWAVSLFWMPPAIASDASTVVLGAALLGASYAIGVLVNVMCRLFVDFLSETVTRGWVFKMFAREKLGSLTWRTSHRDINDAYNLYFEAAKKEKDTDTAREFSKRRQTGRLVRSSLIPAVLVTTFTAQSFGWNLWLMGFATYLAILFVYGYAEVSILHEAYYAVPPELRDVAAVVDHRLTVREKRPVEALENR